MLHKVKIGYRRIPWIRPMQSHRLHLQCTFVYMNRYFLAHSCSKDRFKWDVSRSKCLTEICLCYENAQESIFSVQRRSMSLYHIIRIHTYVYPPLSESCAFSSLSSSSQFLLCPLLVQHLSGPEWCPEQWTSLTVPRQHCMYGLVEGHSGMG